jgi:hypothetical protein
VALETTFPGSDLFPGDTVVPVPAEDDFNLWTFHFETQLTELAVDNLDPNTEYEIQIRAVSTDGITSDWTDSIWYITPHDADAPSVPSAPIVTAKLGAFTVTWDGKTENGGKMEPDFAYVNVWANSTKIGSISVATGGTIAWNGGDYGATYAFSLSAVDTNGNESVKSETTGQATVPIVDVDLINAKIDGANIQPGTINAADAIIGNTITGDLIEANSIDGDRIKANSITADQLDVGALNGVTLTGVTINGGIFETTGRSEVDDTEPGWFIGSDGHATVNSSDGVKYFEVKPSGSNPYVLIGDESSAHLKVGKGAITGLTTLDLAAGLINLVDPGGSGRHLQFAIDGVFNQAGLTTDSSTSLVVVSKDLNFSTSPIGGQEASGSITLDTSPTTGGHGPYFHLNKSGTVELGVGVKDNGDRGSSSGFRLLYNSGLKLWVDQTVTTTFSFGQWNVAADDGISFNVFDGDAKLTINPGSSSDPSHSDIRFDQFLPSTSSTANMFYDSSSGRIFKGSTSASKYKVNVEDASYPTDIPLNPKTWYDRAASETYAAALDKADGDPSKIPADELSGILDIKPIPGVIAEDVVAAGLDEYVTYVNGEIDGLMYDRLWIPYVKGLLDRVAALEAQLASK